MEGYRSTAELEAQEMDAAASIAAFLREQAASLRPASELRSLALRSAGCWSTIAGRKQERHLALVTLDSLDLGPCP